MSRSERTALTISSRILNYALPMLVVIAAVLIRILMSHNMRLIIHTDSITFLFLRELDTVRTPGYPLFIEGLLTLNDLLSLTIEHIRVIVLGQLGLGILNSFLIFRLAERLTGNRIFAAIMGIVYNFNYFVVGFELQVMTETLSLSLLLGLLLISADLFRKNVSTAFLAGALSVLLIYTRATYLLFFAAIPFVVFAGYLPHSKSRDFLRKTAPVLAVFLAVNIAGIAAWSLRNKHYSGYFGMSTLMPYQLRYFTNPLFKLFPPSGDPILDRTAEVYAEEFAATGWTSETVSNFHLRLSKDMNLTDAEIAKFFMKANMRLIRSYPGKYIKQLPDSFLSYYRQYSPYWASHNNPILLRGRGLLPALFRTFFEFYLKLFTTPLGLVLLLVAAPVVLLTGTFRRKEIFVGWLLVTAAIHYNGFVSFLSTNAGLNSMRYRAPVEPLILLMFYAAVFFLGCFALEAAREKRRRKRGAVKKDIP